MLVLLSFVPPRAWVSGCDGLALQVTVVGTIIMGDILAEDEDQQGPFSTVQYSIQPGPYSVSDPCHSKQCRGGVGRGVGGGACDAVEAWHRTRGCDIVAVHVTSPFVLSKWSRSPVRDQGP